MSTARRRSVLLAATLLLVAACGTDDATEATEPTTTPPTSTSAGTVPAGFPREIPHAYGSTQLATAPERVATIGFTDHDTVLALGVTPVLVREWFGGRPSAAWPWAADLVDTPPVVMEGELNYELIASVDPDVIIAAYAGLTEDEYGLLSQIAPTVAQSATSGDYLTPWQEMATTIGATLGRDAEAAALVDDVEAQLAAVAAEYPQLAGTAGVAVNTRDDGTFGVRSATDARGRFLAAVGIEQPAPIAELVPAGEFVAPISFERIDLIGEGLDVLVWAPEDDADRAFVESLKLYDGEGRLVFIGEEEAAALGFSSVLSLPWAIDQIVPRLAAAVDGDPATDVGVPR